MEKKACLFPASTKVNEKWPKDSHFREMRCTGGGRQNEAQVQEYQSSDFPPRLYFPTSCISAVLQLRDLILDDLISN